MINLLLAIAIFFPMVVYPQAPEPVDSVDVRHYGAIGDGIRDDTAAIQSAIDSGAKIVNFSAGEYLITDTLVVSGNGVTLQGAGGGWVAYMYGYPPDTDVGTSLKWNGEVGGTLLRIGDGVEPNAGCTIRDLVLDGNYSASNLLVADATYYLEVDNLMGVAWQHGFAVVVTHSEGVRGSGEKYHTWNHVTLVNPGEGGSGLDIAPAGSLNVNQVTFTSCNIGRANTDDPSITSLRMGYADHITFNRCVFMCDKPAHEWRDYERYNPYAITVAPIADHRHFPMNIAFYGSAIYGGINYDNANLWAESNYSSLLFYPFYTADGQTVPPNGYINGDPATLPLNMVGGFTDLGQPLRGQ